MHSVREATQEIIKLGLVPMFKRHGFRKTGFNFSRRRGTVEHHFNIQLSQWNQASRGHFYLNAGVLFDDLRRLRGEDSLVAAKCYDCEFDVHLEQIDPLLPQQFVFRFTKIWEKIIVIIGEEWTERILINQERVEPRFA